jgi:hypothetical protein
MSRSRITAVLFGVFALVSVTGCGGGGSSAYVESVFRTIAVRSGPDATFRYNRIESQVIGSRAELDARLAATGFTDASDPFIESLRSANVDFDQEALVLLRYNTSSGFSEVSLDTPRVEGTTFASTFRTQPGPGGGLGIEIQHAYAFSVSRARVREVRVPVVYSNGGNSQTLRTIVLTVPR